MDYYKAKDYILKEIEKTGFKQQNFIVKTNNGKRKQMQMFVSDNGLLCYKTNARANFGYQLTFYEVENWASVTVKKPFQASVKLVRKRAKECVDMLTKSGLWADVKAGMEEVLKLSDSQIAQFIKDCKEDYYTLVWHDETSKYPALSGHEYFHNLVAERCWTSIPFTKCSRDRLTKELGEHLQNKQKYHHSWSNGYDCSVELSFEHGVGRGWMSMEFVGCGNGHYYFLLDEKHAMFIEDD